MLVMVRIECPVCAGIGYTRRPEIPGARVWCNHCAGHGDVPYEVNCQHEWSTSGYGNVEDPQWDGAEQCDGCGAIFAEWPRFAPSRSTWHDGRSTCVCSHLRSEHRQFSDSCVSDACQCERYEELVHEREVRS